MGKNGLLRIIGISLSSSMSNTMKSSRNLNLSTLTKKFSIMPLRYLRDLSSNCKVTIIGLASLRPNFLKMDRGIKLMLAPRPHSAFSKVTFSNVSEYEKHEMLKLLGSLSFGEILF